MTQPDLAERIRRAIAKVKISVSFYKSEGWDINAASLEVVISTLTDCLTALEPRPFGWIRCGDRLPEQNTKVLLDIFDGISRHPNLSICLGYLKIPFGNKRKLEWTDESGERVNPHHWMPLPTPPLKHTE